MINRKLEPDGPVAAPVGCFRQALGLRFFFLAALLLAHECGKAQSVAALLSPVVVQLQEGATPDREGNAEPQTGRTGPASDIVVESMASYGNYRLFASGSATKLYTAGFQYDRHSWGRLFGARFDYVFEFLPVMLLDVPKTQDIWGSPTSPDRKIVPGIGFSPIGVRLLWRDKKAIKPFFMSKGGMAVFTEKALSQKATYENFTLQELTGVNVRMNDRFDLRLGVFGDFHMSNGFMVPVNPGVDVMNANIGISYNLGHNQGSGR